MTITVNIADVDLSELLAKVEAGEEIILVRDGVSVATIAPIAKNLEQRQKAIEDIRIFRARMPRVTQEEMAEWKSIGQR